MKVTIDTSLDELFNAFIADEMWAALNYKNAAFVSKGKALKFSNGIFNDNSDEEFEHMEELVDMAQSLGIKVKVNPKDAETNCTTPYVDLASDEDTKKLVKIFLKTERAAIDGYQTALKNKNVLEKPELCQFFGEICNDEHDHLKELMDLASNVGVSDGTEEEKSEEKPTDGAEDVEKAEKDDDSDSDTEKSILNVGSPLTGTADDGEDDDEEEEESEKDAEKAEKDVEKDEKDEKKSDDDDSDEDEDDEDGEDEEDDEDEDDEKSDSINESTIPYDKKCHSVCCMMKNAFKKTSKKGKKGKKSPIER